MEKGDGGWCPLTTVSTDKKEFLQIDLEDYHRITEVQVQGRYAGGKGMEFTEYFKLQYWRTELLEWKTYRSIDGKEVT